MAASHRLLNLRLERLRGQWEFTQAEVDLHKHRLLGMLVLLVGTALTVLASVLLEKVTPRWGIPFAGVLLLGALDIHRRLLLLSERLRAAADARDRAIGGLMKEEER